MTALKIIGIILLIFLLIGLLRVGATIRFGEETIVKLRVGFLRLTVFPGKKKEKKKQSKEDVPAEKKEKKARKLPKLTLEDLFDLAATVISALGKTIRRICRRLRIDPLRLSIVFGGTDPADVAETYGMANAFVWSVMPKAEEIFYLPDPNIHLEMSYETEETHCEGTVGISFRIFDVLSILLTLALPLIRWFLHLKRIHANDPNFRGDSGKRTKGATEQTAEKLPV